MSDKQENKAGAVRAVKDEPSSAAAAAQTQPAAPAPATKAELKADPNEQKRIDATAEREIEKEAGELDDSFVIAKGKAVTSLAGVLDEGEAVSAKHFHRGEEDFKRLQDAGIIVRKSK